MTNNNNLIASLLRDDKSKVATLIACGASVYALIYYNREVRNQIANIFMVRFLFFSRRRLVFRWSSFIIISFWWWWWWWCLCSCVREKKDAHHLLRVLILREMAHARCDARERKRDGEWINLKNNDERDWILGPNSLSPPSSFHLHQRGFFFPVLMTLSCLFSHARRVYSIHNASVRILIHWPTVFLSFY